MNTNEDGFLKELLAMFKIEAEEHIKAITLGLLELEKAEDVSRCKTVLETIYREAHSLKGAARAVNLQEVESLCQTLESVFALIKRQELALNHELFDVLHNAVDGVETLVEKGKLPQLGELMSKLTSIEEGRPATSVKPSAPVPEKVEVKEAEKSKSAAAAVEPSVPEKAVPEETKPAEPAPEVAEPSTEAPDTPLPTVEFSDTIRLPVSKLDSILLQAEEMLGAKLAADQYVNDLRGLSSFLSLWNRELEKERLHASAAFRQTEREIDDGRDISQLVGWNQEQVKSLELRLSMMSKNAENNSRLLDGMINSLLEDMKQILMLPFSTLLKMMPKIVRDLSRDQRKEVQLISKGSTVEVDRRILEEMKDPLIHLFRNCIDHGLEKPDERRKKGKDPTGTLSIVVSQKSGDKVLIEVNDDGHGIDADVIKKTAIKRGVITKAIAADMSEAEALQLIFQSDFSTSPIITDISGRGLGMAIVREKVEKLGGTLTIETKVGEGTSFSMLLPVTVATFRGILVKSSGFSFVIPTHQVESTLRIRRDSIKTVENRETLMLGGQAISLLPLSDVLELPKLKKEKEKSDYVQVMIISANDEQVGFYVDKVMKEQEVLVKGLGNQLQRVRNIAGATILGDGRVVTILNAADLIKSALKVKVVSGRRTGAREETVEQKSILIAEDSITSRTLLKNILTTAGYNVTATVDGMEAYTTLREGAFDLVVSDVEMPRMNGFDLVSKIRHEEKTLELPVILVTGLESREDRERGIEVGANAYIVKRSFDQSNLLEVIKKLI